MLKEIIIAIDSYFKAHQFIRRHRMWKWIIIPGLIYMLLFAGGIVLFATTANDALHWFNQRTGLHAWLESSNSGMLNFLVSLGEIVVTIILLLIYFSFFKYFWLIVGSPVFAWLSEKTESIIQGSDYPFSFPQFMRDVWRGIRLALRNTLWQTVYMLALLMIGLIPFLGWAAPVLSLLVECYYYGFSMIDYSLERRKLKPADSIQFVGNHKGLAIGNGMVFYAMHLIPVIGWIFAPAYAVIAATISLNPPKDR